jgi:putative tryptophan/tyrosine transport system substrate-binding protein
VKRRDLFAFAAASVVAWPPGALGDHLDKSWRIGFLAQGHEGFYEALFGSLRSLGYVEGKNLFVERRYAEGHSDRFVELAADLVNLKPDLIVVTTTPAALAVKNIGIPVVFPNAVNPIESGVIASFANPGGNVTGGAIQTATLSAKRLGLLKEVVPQLSRVSVLWNIANPALAYPWRETQLAAEPLGVELVSVGIQRPEDIEAALATIVGNHTVALIVLQDALTLQHRDRIVGFAAQQRLPGLFAGREWVISGGLMSYGENLEEMYRRSAYVVDKILKGAKPAGLPVEQVTKFELIINLKTAKAIGLTIPLEMLATAEEVVE